jgi:hypothetical protein
MVCREENGFEFDEDRGYLLYCRGIEAWRSLPWLSLMAKSWVYDIIPTVWSEVFIVEATVHFSSQPRILHD